MRICNISKVKIACLLWISNPWTVRDKSHLKKKDMKNYKPFSSDILFSISMKITMQTISHAWHIKAWTKWSDDIFKCIFMNHFLCFDFDFTEVCFSKDPTGNNLALVQALAWHWTGARHFCIKYHCLTTGTHKILSVCIRTYVFLGLMCSCQHQTRPAQIARFIGPIWGPPGSCRPQMGPMLAPWTLLSGWIM